MNSATSQFRSRLLTSTTRLFVILTVVPLVMGGVIPVLEYSDGQLTVSQGVSVAEAAIEQPLRPQSNTTDGGDTTSITNAYDTSITSQSVTTYGGNQDPELTLYNWKTSAVGSTTALALEVKYEATTPSNNDQYRIKYSLDQTSGTCDVGTGTWTDLVAFTSSAASDGTIASTSLSASQNLTQVCVAVESDQVQGGDTGTIYLEDVRIVRTVASDPITVSGTLYSDEGTTQITSGKTIKLAIDTDSTITIYSTSTASGSGSFSFTVENGLLVPGTPIAIWLDGDAVDASVVSTVGSDTTANISGLDLYADTVIVRNGDTATSTDETILEFYDNDDDADLQYRASSTGESLSILGGQEIHIWNGYTFAPPASTTFSGSFHNDGGVFAPTGVTRFTGTNETIFGTATGTSNLGNIIIEGSYTIANTASTTGFTIADTGSTTFDGTIFNVTGDMINEGGSFANNGELLLSSSLASATGTFTGDGALGNVRVNTPATPYTGESLDNFYRFSSSTSGVIADGGTSNIDEIASSVVFNDNLYIGTSKANGAEVWRYDGTTWTKLSQPTAGTIASGGTTGIDGVTSMAVASGTLYIGTNEANAAEVYRYDGGTSWTKVSQATAGTIASGGTAGINEISSMTATASGTLYIGTIEANAAEVYRYDGGTSWTKVSQATAGTIAAGGTTLISGVVSMLEYDGSLYIGTERSSTTESGPIGAAEVYRYDGGTSWTKVSQPTAGIIATGGSNLNFQILSMSEFDGSLYIGTGALNGAAEVYRYDGGTSWTQLNTAGTPGRFGIIINLSKVRAMAVVADSLYIGMGGISAGLVYRYDGGTTWTSMNDGSEASAAGRLQIDGTTGIDDISTLADFRGLLIAGTKEAPGRAEVYRQALSGTAYGPEVRTAAETSNLTIDNSSSVIFLDSLTITGDYTNNGIVNFFDTATTTFDGASLQTATGTMTGASELNNIVITNTSGTDAQSAPGVIFGATASSTGNLSINTPGVMVQFEAGATTTFQNMNLTGSTSDYVYLHSTDSGTQFNVDVTGTTTADYVYFKDTNACNSSSGSISTTNSFDSNANNDCILGLDSTAGVTTILAATSSDPLPFTIAPGSAATTTNAFALVGTAAETITAITLAHQNASSASLIEITSNDGATVYGSTTTAVGTSTTITLDTNISVTTSTTTYKIRMTPKGQADLPSGNRGELIPFTATVLSWTGTNLLAGTDTAFPVIIDNQSLAAFGTESNALSFAAKVDYATQIDPRSVTHADFNNDGYTDLAVANQVSSSITVFLNEGDGTYNNASSTYTATSPFYITSADVNNDGYSDLITADFGPDTASVILNDGDGTFDTSSSTYDTGTNSNPRTIATADYNNDGYIDFSVGNSNASNIPVFINQGDGTYAERVDYVADSFAVTVTNADYDNDGFVDIAATVSGGTLMILFNDGDGTFDTATSSYSTGQSSTIEDVITADFNDDGHTDIASLGSDAVSVHVNNGDGTFGAKVDYSTVSNPERLFSADFNNDGYTDLATANGVSSLSVFMNDGDGTFASKDDYSTDNTSYSIIAADLNNDGYNDLVTANRLGDSVSVLFNNATTTLSATTSGAGSGEVIISYTTPPQEDIDSIVILASTSPVTDAPSDGTTYTGGEDIGGASVACVDNTVATSTADSCTATGLTGGTSYYFSAFVYDTSGNYSFGVQATGSPVTLEALVTDTATLTNHSDGQVSNTFSFQNKTDEVFFAFQLGATTSITVSELTVSLTGSNGVTADELENFRLFVDENNNAVYDSGTDTQVGGTPVLSINGQAGSIAFSSDFSFSTTTDYILVGDTAGIDSGESITFALNPSTITFTGDVTITGSVDSIQHFRPGGGGGGGRSFQSAGDRTGEPAPAGDSVTTGGADSGGADGGRIDTNTGGDTIGNAPDFFWPTADSGTWSNGANAYDQTDGTYATTTASVAHNFTTFNDGVPGTDSIEGIAVKLEVSGTTAAGDITVALSWDGGVTWTSAKTTPTLTTTDTVVTVGGPSDTWGRDWVPGEFSNANFVVRVTGAPSGNTIQLDAVQVRVYHQATGGSSGGGGRL